MSPLDRSKKHRLFFFFFPESGLPGSLGPDGKGETDLPAKIHTVTRAETDSLYIHSFI